MLHKTSVEGKKLYRSVLKKSKNPKDPKKKKRNAAVDQMVFSCVSITEIDVLMKLHINYL